MRKENARENKAMDIALEQLDYIIKYHTAPDFVEVTGEMGGDVITYRIYDDGSVYERQKYQERSRTMIKLDNGKYIIGFDNGYQFGKTANFMFDNGVFPSGSVTLHGQLFFQSQVGHLVYSF